LASESESHRTRAIVGVTIALAIAIVLVLGYVARGLLAGPRSPAEKLTLALSATPDAALIHLAASNGYFADEGLDVAVVPVSHGKAALELLAQGKADLASAAEVPFVIAIMRGEPLGIAATVASVSTEMAVVARRDRAIAGPRDLVGKRVGVTTGTNGEYFLWAFMIRHMLAPDSVAMVDLAPGQMVQALSAGSIDAVSTWEPITSAAESTLAGNALSFDGADAYTVTHVVVGRSEFLKGRHDAVAKFVRALLKAEAFNRSEPSRAIQLVADRLKLDIKTLEPAWKDVEFKVDMRQSQLVTLEDEARWAMARGYADRGPVPNFLPHLHLDALLAVQPERVTVVH